MTPPSPLISPPSCAADDATPTAAAAAATTTALHSTAEAQEVGDDEVEEASSSKPAQLGLLTFDLDDTLYPVKVVIEEAVRFFFPVSCFSPLLSILFLCVLLETCRGSEIIFENLLPVGIRYAWMQADTTVAYRCTVS